MSAFGQCPRCGRWAIEHLRTHSHCWECSYFPELQDGVNQWRALEFRKSKFLRQRSNSRSLERSMSDSEFERLRLGVVL